MASVKRKRGTKYWIACYTMPNGIRKQVSSHLEDKNLAMQFALKMERAAGSLSRGSLTRQDALRLVEEIAALAEVRISDPTSSREFCTRFFEAKAKLVAPSTAKKHATALKSFLSFAGPLADFPLERIHPSLVAEWRNRMLSDGLAAETVRGNMVAMGMCFREAVDEQRIEESPFATIKRPSVKRGDSPKKAFTWEQFAALVAATDGEWRICILLGGFTGQRQQDVAQLDWQQVNLAKRLITFRRAKTDDTIVVPMHPDLHTALVAWHKAHGRPGAGKVMPEIAALPRTTAGAFPAVFRFKILPRIGIEQPYVRRAEERARTPSAYSFHSLRHMLSTALNSAGVSAETRMRIVGHADRSVSAGYTHAQLDDAAKALLLLPGLG